MPTKPEDLSSPGTLAGGFFSGCFFGKGSGCDDIRALVRLHTHFGRVFRELPASPLNPYPASREFTTALLNHGIKWGLVLTFTGLGGIVPRHLFRRAGYGRARDFRDPLDGILPRVFRTNHSVTNFQYFQEFYGGKYPASQKARTSFQTAQPIMDSMVNKGIFTKNKVARQKSRMSTKIKALKSA